MKQGINPMNNLHILQDASRSRSNSRTTFTGDDAERKKCRIEVLISTKRDNKFKLSDKKALAVRVYDNSDGIEADIMTVDPVGNLSLEGRFDANLETISSKNRIKTMSNDSLAQWFLDIYPIVDAINSGLVDLHRARQDAAMLIRGRTFLVLAQSSLQLKYCTQISLIS